MVTRILLVDDRPANVLALEATLSPLGQKLITATSAAEAIQAVRAQDFAVVLMDVMMPGKDGLQAASEIKEFAPHIPIIFLTAHEDLVQRATRAYALGAVDYIVKPFDPGMLRSKVSVFVELARRGEQLRLEERARAREHALREHAEAERATLNQLFSRLPAAIAVLRGARFEIEFANERQLSAWGLTASDLGRPLFELIVEPFPNARELCSHVLETGAAHVSSEMRVSSHNGSELCFFDFVISPFHSSANEVSGLFLFSFDVTEKVLARQKVEDASRIKDEFLATVSHELRTPLSAIMGWVSLLETRPRTEAMVQKAVEVIGRNARAQVRIIDDILDVARIIRGKLHIELVPSDLCIAITEALEAVRNQAEQKHIHVESLGLQNSCPMMADGERLRQVFANLLSNAIKFTPQGGNVRLTIERQENETVIAISDTGIGITPELLSLIFERFRQGDSSTTRAYGGVGLGLAIVRHIVEAHGGTVHADSPGSGRGATFTVRLPTVPPRLSTSTPAHGRKIRSASPALTWLSPTALLGVHIVFAEDDEDTRDAVVATLKSSGAEVTAVASAAEALEELERALPHLLITDISMPERDGYWLLAQVKSKYEKLPVIALTAHTRAEDEQRAVAAGFSRHVAKPVEPRELVDQVRQLVGS